MLLGYRLDTQCLGIRMEVVAVLVGKTVGIGVGVKPEAA